MADAPDPTRDPGLIKSLGLWDVVAMNIVAVVGLRWIARSARVGAPSVTLWTLAGSVFFLPLAAALAELSSRDPAQGGIFASFVRLRRMDDAPRAPEASDVRVPGGWLGAWAVTACGVFATVVAIGLVFVPPTGTASVLSYEANLVGQAAGVLGGGLCFYWWSRHTTAKGAHT